MWRVSVWCVGGVMILLWGEAAGADTENLNQLIHGDYVFTGEATCIVALPPGFNPNLTPRDGRYTLSFSVQGVRTFNGDGTGALTGRSVSVTHADTPVTLGGASSSDFQASFTYNVAPDRTFTTVLSGPLTGTILTGTRAGQTFTITNFPLLTGLISQDHKSLTLASEEPIVEVITYSGGPNPTEYRICHRSRALFRLKQED